MSSEIPSLHGVPMPYLTPIYKKFIKDAASIRHHINGSLKLIWHEAIEYAEEGSHAHSTSRADRLAHAKKAFTIEVCYSSACPELNRALFELPLDDIFDKWAAHFAIFNRRSVRPVKLADWFAMCAMHPEADVDNTLAPELRKYNMRPGSAFCYLNAPDASPFGADFPPMAQALEEIYVYLGESEYVSALQAFAQVGANIVDGVLALAHDRHTNGRGIEVSIKDALRCVHWAWHNMLDDPFGSITPAVRGLLANLVDTGPLVSMMEWHRHSLVRYEGVNDTNFHLMVWTSILGYADTTPSVSRRELSEIIPDTSILDADQRQQTIAALEGELPVIKRPAGTVDQITAELPARLALYEFNTDNNEGGTDVPIEAVGPTIDPRMLGHSGTEAPSPDERCPTCCINFADTEESFLALHACGHLFHVDCLDPWVNRVALGLTRITCPCCRAELCDARDYRGVVQD